MILKYKGIAFDDYVYNEDGYCWAEMCQECAERFGALVSEELDDGGTACGCCSVKGCDRAGNDFEKKHYYIDFDIDYISFEEE